MHTRTKMPVILGGLALVLAAIVLLGPTSGCSQQGTQSQAGHPQMSTTGLPMLLDLGAKQCLPCKMMAPILDDLKANYATHFDTVFIDVWEDPKAAGPYGIRNIPTQIFFDAEGKELFRHVGFMSKDDIFATWRQLGYDFPTSAGG